MPAQHQQHSTAPLVLLQRDVEWLSTLTITKDSSSNKEGEKQSRQRSTTFDVVGAAGGQGEKGEAGFVAMHEYGEDGERRGTVLCRGKEVLGNVSLRVIRVGATGTRLAYRNPHCFSSKKLFKLEKEGAWVCWRKSSAGAEGSREMQLVEYKSKKVLVTVVTSTTPAAPETRLILHPAFFPSFTSSTTSPPRPLAAATSENSSSAFSSSSTLALPTPTSAPPSSPLPPTPTSPSRRSLFASLLLHRKPSSLSSSSKPVANQREQSDVTRPVAVVLLTLLHREYVGRERERREVERERDLRKEEEEEREEEREEREEMEGRAW